MLFKKPPIFGVAMYFLVSTNLLQIDKTTKSFAFFVTVSFLAGFSERWTRVILDGAQNVIGVDRHTPEVTEAHVPPPEPAGGGESEATVPPPPPAAEDQP